MSFFGSGNKAKSVVLIDISSSSVGGAYARISPNAPVAMLYTVRIPIESSTETTAPPLMLRALDTVVRALREQGAPILHRRTGSGGAHAVMVHAGIPWQTSEIHHELFADEKPFVFSDALLEKTKKMMTPLEGRYQTEESILGTILNGYETTNPLGKKVKRAEVMLLHATMEDEQAKLIKRSLGSFTALHEVRFSGLPSLLVSSIPQAFPHEKDYMALRVSGNATELVFVKRGFPLFTTSFASGLSAFADAARQSGFKSFPDGGGSVDGGVTLDAHFLEVQQKWTSAFAQCLKAYTANNALPRTLFLIADPDAHIFIRRMLDVPEIHALWLSDEPLATVPLENKHFASAVAYEPEVADDLVLAMLGLRARQ